MTSLFFRIVSTSTDLQLNFTFCGGGGGNLLGATGFWVAIKATGEPLSDTLSSSLSLEATLVISVACTILESEGMVIYNRELFVFLTLGYALRGTGRWFYEAFGALKMLQIDLR
jgi:hypothetical protein